MARKQTEPRPKTVFVVMRDNWRRSGPRWYRGVGQARVASFVSPQQAEDDRARREENARLRLNPFTCGDALADLTSYPEPVFLDWVQDAGLTPPPPPKKGGRDWAAWWAELPLTAGAPQRLKVWQALDKVRFYSVAERPDVPVGYALVSPIWQYNDEYDYLEGEGGAVQAVYRTRQRAEEEALKQSGRDRGTRGDWTPSGLDPFDPETHWQLFARGATYDIVEIELEGLS